MYCQIPSNVLSDPHCVLSDREAPWWRGHVIYYILYIYILYYILHIIDYMLVYCQRGRLPGGEGVQFVEGDMEGEGRIGWYITRDPTVHY